VHSFGTGYDDSCDGGYSAWVTPAMIARWYAYMDEAESLATDAERKRLVRIARLPIQHTEALIAKRDDSFPIHVYPCARAGAAPVLDGKLDDAVWQRASLVSGFTLLSTDKLVSPQTSFRLLWDDKHLYLGVQCDEPQMDKISPMRYARDELAVFDRESIEFFVDPNHTHDLYYQLAFNVAGSLYDGERFTVSWNSGAEVKTHFGDKFWSAEVAVPWGPLKAGPNPGKVVGFNVNRTHNIEEKTFATWAGVQRGFHDPERFAHLVLSGTPEMIGKLSGEFRKGGSTGPIVVYSAEGKLDAATWTRDETKHRKLMQAWLDDSRALGANDRPKWPNKGPKPLQKWAEANQLEWK
jgi:hypothetical protein